MSVDLTTRYLGINLHNPLVVSACPLTWELESLQRLEEAGAAAAVMPSLFEEQIEHEETEMHWLYEYQTESFAESLSYFPEPQRDEYHGGPDSYLKRIEEAKQAISIPLIASLNGQSKGGWIRYARLIEEAGADALELNIYFVPTDAHMKAEDVENRYVELVAAVRETVSLPLCVKIGPFFSSLPHFAQRVAAAGADGLVLFNRFLAPDLDIEALLIKPDLILSNRNELWLSLRWIAIVRDQLSISLAANSGIHFADDVIKSLLAGADVAMMASVILRYGPDCLRKLHDETRVWLEEHEYTSVEQLKGSMSRANCPDPSALERANYTKALVSFTDKFMQ